MLSCDYETMEDAWFEEERQAEAMLREGFDGPVKKLTPNPLLNDAARALHKALQRDGYVGDYEFHDGRTTLDGEFDLIVAAQAVLRAADEHRSLPDGP